MNHSVCGHPLIINRALYLSVPLELSFFVLSQRLFITILFIFFITFNEYYKMSTYHFALLFFNNFLHYSSLFHFNL
jgi:hypothetical protein